MVKNPKLGWIPCLGHPKCETLCFQMGPSSHSTSQKTICPCLGGLKGWKLTLKSTGCFSCKTMANLSTGNAKIWRSNGLLLPFHTFKSTGLYLCEVSSRRSHHTAWTPQQPLPKIPLWNTLYWAVLGGGKAIVQVWAMTQENAWDGKASSSMPQWHPIVADLKVQILKLYLIKWLTHSFWSIRFASHSALFMDAYQKGLNGPQAVQTIRKYHGHWVLPNNIMETLEAAGKA